MRTFLFVLVAIAVPATIGFGATAVPVSSGLHYRYAADSITGLSDGDRVAAWHDLSGGGRDVTQSDAARQPFYQTNVLNGLPVVSFTTANQYLSKTGDAFDAATLFVVGMADYGHSGVFLSEFNTGGTGNRAWMLLAQGGGHSRWFTVPDSGASSALEGPADSALDWSVMTAAFSDAGDGYNEYFINGESIATNTTNPCTTGNANLYIGAYQAAGTPPSAAHLRGDIAEIIAYNRVLSTVERQLVNSALTAKYDLGANDLYKGAAQAYYFNVFGIGKDAGDAITTSSDQGYSTGLILSEAAALQDGQYVLAGDRNLNNAWVTENLPSGVLQRWDRDWFVTPTGDAADVNMLFDFDDAGLVYNASATYDVLYREDSADAFHRMNLTGTYDNGQLAFTIGDGQLVEGIYTLGVIPEPTTFLLLVTAIGLLCVYPARRRIVAYSN